MAIPYPKTEMPEMQKKLFMVWNIIEYMKNLQFYKIYRLVIIK